MQRTKRRSAEAWRELVARFSQSGLTEEDFCEREGVDSKLFHRWRAKRSNGPPRSAASKVVPHPDKGVGFVDIGALKSGGSRFEVRLELGAGVILSVARG
jgi:hypothetical protein